jgi:glycosyltransferase involved in cell wall biosynthesis
MIAYNFPPQAGASGIQRTLRFVKHLPAAGWEPLVLTTVAGAYERTSPDLDAEVPGGLVVRRAFALDTARHLSIRRRYLAALARPDRWVSWRFDAVRIGMQMVHEFKPAVLWSTYPIATAHVIGRRLHAKTGLPWVADFRDPMTQNGYPADPKTRAIFKKIEKDAISTASRNVFTTPGAAREYANRYPEYAAGIRLIENGYDEESFVAVQDEAAALGPLDPGRLTVVHSGIVYPSERNPTQLMEALGQLKQAGIVDASRLSVRFRAAVHDELLRELGRRFNVADLIEIAPPLGYRQALLEMMRADALLVLQAAICNEQIPAKIYEYLRAGRPLLVLTDPAGNTAQALQDAGVRRMARLDDASGIAALVGTFVTDPKNCTSLLATASAVRSASREGRTREFAQVLDQAAAASAR